MRFSRTLKSSTQSIPSPNGAYIATIFPSQLSIRETRSLEISRVISLPPDLTTSITYFLWSASSTRVLVASAENIRIFSLSNPQFSASITHPTAGTTKVAFLAFGANEDEILVFSDFGLKLSIHNLTTSKSVEINAPKFYNPSVATRGYAYRHGTSHLALLTRSGGKDVISVHGPKSLDIKRSWWPDTIDAQGLSWSADGRWLIVWESASQGHRLFIYTADGHLFKTWNGPVATSDEDAQLSLGAGIKLLEWSSNGAHIALGDFSMRVTLLSAPWFSESMTIQHTLAVTPAETLQIWQEQISPSPSGGAIREFVQATQAICPPTTYPAHSANAEPKTGTCMISFDHSGTLLATRTENMPTTVWIWDIGTRILRAVMILHASIAKISWHPSINELLMIRCEGDEGRRLVHIWDPSWPTPQILDFATQMPGGKILGKTKARWLNVDDPHPAIYFSDSQDCLLLSISEPEDGDVPWQDSEIRGVDIYGQREESPLNLVPAPERTYKLRKAEEFTEDEKYNWTASGESDEVEDTFQFRKFVEPDDSFF